MIVVYDSLTGEGKKFAESLGYPTQSIKEELNEDCILVTRNIGLGQIPLTTKSFVKKNKDKIQGFVNNGNLKMHRLTYCGASDKLVKKYGLVMIRNIDRGGNEEDIQAVKDFLEHKVNI